MRTVQANYFSIILFLFSKEKDTAQQGRTQGGFGSSLRVSPQKLFSEFLGTSHSKEQI